MKETSIAAYVKLTVRFIQHWTVSSSDQDKHIVFTYELDLLMAPAISFPVLVQEDKALQTARELKQNR